MDYKAVLQECKSRAELYRGSDAVWNLTHEENCITAITDLLARAEEAERKAKDLEQALSDASKIVKTMQDSTIPFYRRRAEEAERQRDEALKDYSASESKHALEIERRKMAESHCRKMEKALEDAKARAEKAERERDAAVQCLVEKCRHIESTERGDYCVIDDEPCDRCIGVWRGQKEE